MFKTVFAYGRSNKSKTIVDRSKIIDRIHYLEIGCTQNLLIGVIPISNRVLKNTLLCNTHIYKLRFQLRFT